MHVLKLMIVSMFTLVAPVVKSQTAQPAAPVKNNEIIFASDTQAPMWIETLWLKSHNNRSATKQIFDDILQRQPADVFLLGDVVNLGYSNRQWKPIDACLQRLRSKSVNVCAILGNHEVMGRSKRGQKKFQVRFPNHVNTGYVEITDSVAIVLLNSNFRSLSPSQNAMQVSWYKKTLDELDADSSIKFIISGCHHSPYTNSTIVRSSLAVREKFVPLFLKSAKSRLFLSGHSHNFEHFKTDGKDFFVIGGGGGLHQPLKQGDGIFPDLSPKYKPMFHYLSIRRENDELRVSSIELKPDFSGFDEGLSMTIKSNSDVAVPVFANHSSAN